MVVEGSDIIQTSCMVLVIVSQQYGVNTDDAFTQHLISEVRSCIDKYPESHMFDQDTGSESFVTGVGAKTHIAAASYHGYAL